MLMDLINEYTKDSILDVKKDCLRRLDKILLHPLSRCFLHVKWHETRLFFYFLLFCHTVFSFTYSGYIILLYNTYCNPLEWKMKVNEDEYQSVWSRFTLELECSSNHHQWAIVTLWLFLVVFMIIYSVKEVTRCLHQGKK